MEELRKMIDGQKKPHFVQGQTESGSAKKPGRIAEDVFRLSPHHLTCWMQIASVQFTKIASELGSGGGGAACSATSKLEQNYYIWLWANYHSNAI
jgi:hypothetical protein